MTDIDRLIGFMAIMQVPFMNDPDALAYIEEVKTVLEQAKTQEPRKPHYTTLKYVVNGKMISVKHPECPRCWDNGLMLWDAEIEKGTKYCKRCGQEVKWDG